MRQLSHRSVIRRFALVVVLAAAGLFAVAACGTIPDDGPPVSVKDKAPEPTPSPTLNAVPSRR